jgi:hypothetical protein
VEERKTLEIGGEIINDVIMKFSLFESSINRLEGLEVLMDPLEVFKKKLMKFNVRVNLMEVF